MAENRSISTFAEMQAANPQGFSALDYVHYAFSENPKCPDFALTLSQLIFPSFVEIEGRILVGSVGAPKKYDEYRAQGQSPQKAQYWANLTEITSLFGGLDDEALVRSWSSIFEISWSLALQATRTTQVVRILKDEVEGELFITITDAP